MRTGRRTGRDWGRLRVCMVMIVLALLVLACSPERADSEESTRRQAGQPPDSLQTAVRLAAIRAAALRGDQEGIQKHAAAMQEDLRLAMRLPDPMRWIEQEPARAAVMRVEGVRSAGWVDRDHLLVRVDVMTQRFLLRSGR